MYLYVYLYTNNTSHYADTVFTFDHCLCKFFTTDDSGEKYTLSFEELDNISKQLAQVLQKYEKYKMTTSQSLVAVCMKPSDRLPTILLSILKAGMAYLPLDAEFPMSRVKHILEEAKPLVVLVEEGGNCHFYVMS